MSKSAAEMHFLQNNAFSKILFYVFLKRFNVLLTLNLSKTVINQKTLKIKGMDLINEFAYILSKKKPGEFDSFLPIKSKLRRLYDLVIKENVKTDEEAAQIIYSSDKADKKYLMLKRNLVQKLSDLIFLLDYVEEFEDNYSNIQFVVEKELNIIEKLLLENVYHNPTKTIAKVEQTAEKYFLIDLQLAVAKKFRSLYSLKGFPVETEQYNEKVKKLTKYQRYFNEAKGMWEILYSKTKYTIAKIPEFVFEAYHYSEILRKWLHDYDSPFLQLFYYKINIIKYDQQNYFNEVFENINNLKKLIEEFSFIKSKSLLLDINCAYASYYRNIRQLDKAEEYIRECMHYCDYRAFNKFLVQQLLFDIKIKKEQYLDAGEILAEIYKVPQYEFLDPYDKSAWAIREAYLFFIYYSIDQTDGFKYLPSYENEFSLKLFLNRTKKSSKDKYGYNIQFLIIRLLLMAKENMREIDNEGNNLLMYYHRYLKELNSLRTISFFKALGKIAAVGFEKEEMSYRKDKLLAKYNETEQDFFDVFELIPYEKFWELIPKFLNKI